MLKEVMRGCHTILWLLNLGGLGWAGGSLTSHRPRQTNWAQDRSVEGKQPKIQRTRRTLPPTGQVMSEVEVKRVQAADVILYRPTFDDVERRRAGLPESITGLIDSNWITTFFLGPNQPL